MHAPVLPAVVELDLVESVDRRGAPLLQGHFNGTGHRPAPA